MNGLILISVINILKNNTVQYYLVAIMLFLFSLLTCYYDHEIIVIITFIIIIGVYDWVIFIGGKGLPSGYLT